MMHTGRELMRILKEAGFEVASSRGNHFKMKHEDGRQFIFPFKERQYPKGTYFNIMKLAGISSEALKKGDRP